MADKLYINLVDNPQYTQGSNLPVMIGPANPNAPEGKNWRIGVKIGDDWYNQAAFTSKDEVGGLTIILTPSQSSSKPGGSGGFQQKTFAAKPAYGASKQFGR